MKTVRVEVTAEDIEEGQPNMCRACPVALAIRRATKAEEVFVIRTATIYPPAGMSYVVALPYEVITFIERFDLDAHVEPFEFSLEIPA